MLFSVNKNNIQKHAKICKKVGKKYEKKKLPRKFMILSIEHKIAIKDTITPVRSKSQKEKTETREI